MADSDKPQENIADAPLSFPDSERPAGEWATKKDPVSASERPQEAGASPSYSSQSLQIVKAIEEGMREPSCTQIDGYGPGTITAQVNGQHHLMHGLAFSNNEEYLNWLKEKVDKADTVITWDDIQENKMGVLKLAGGERLTIYLPPVAQPHPTFSLRKHTAIDWKSEKLIELNTLDERMHRFLLACIAAHVNILFVGQMGAGKSSALRAFVQDGAGDDERIAIVEQVPELSISKPLVLHQLYQPTIEGYKLHQVLDFDLYNGLDRLIVGEVHLEGITKMLETMILTEGSMSTYHAFSTEQAGERMKLALQIENPNVTAETAAALIRQAVELVVVLEKRGNTRRVTQITEIDWRASSGSTMLGGSDVFLWDETQQRYKATGSRPDERGRLRAKFLKYGIDIDENAFIEAEHMQRFKER